ncbi:methyltransferase domain-containing protein [Aquabacter sp. L1I39]|uniref:class I SAM-dependent methyltransferase n=1 Tax=Aquabacter sp. L1I39 TaxID=2820278 RepID=UPI001ADAB8CC|nr:methyltransferase domain-containing protein [Aquabacter sp. L1I39]QTL05281.1 methyltransferase domain-containing protein [Aquabacter sp. L1I39]
MTGAMDGGSRGGGHLFQRPEASYVVPDSVIDAVLADRAQPLAWMASLVPDGAQVLDVGAGNGNLARTLLRAGRQVTIDAIEPNAFAADLARPFYRTVHTAFAQDLIAQGSLPAYDAITIADVIEHVSDPYAFLATLDPLVRGGATVFLSVPNIGFGAARLALLNGAFDYVDSGLLERTHLRFITLKTALAVFDALGWAVERVIRLQRSFARVEFDRAALKAPPRVLRRLAFDEEARTYQHLFVLRAGPATTPIRFESAGASARDVLRDLRLEGPRGWLKGLIG